MIVIFYAFYCCWRPFLNYIIIFIKSNYDLCRKILARIRGIIIFVLVIFAAIVARYTRKPIDIGMGPEPMINYIDLKKAVIKKGYTCETFVHYPFFITRDFDIIANELLPVKYHFFLSFYLYFLAIFRYKCLYFYFNGGPLAFDDFYRPLEPYLFKLARTKVVVMSYGGDVHDLFRYTNLGFRRAVSADYPTFLKFRHTQIVSNIDRWIKHADFVLGGADWSYYLYHWDRLIVAHFCIDTKQIELPPSKPHDPNRVIKLLHAPNHREIKGTKYFIEAVESLKQEGYNIELTLLEGLTNLEVKQLMRDCDIVLEQLILGWYGMTLVEGMCLKKPVVSFIDPKLIELFMVEGLIDSPEDIPLVQAEPSNVKAVIKSLLDNPEERTRIGERSRDYILKHHSLEAIGNVFDDINQSLGIMPDLKG